MEDSVEEQDIEIAKMLSKRALIGFFAKCRGDFKCPIMQEIMEHPLMLVNSGHTYESSALLKALSYNPNMDPLTGENVDGEFQTKASYTLKKKAINTWIEKQESIIIKSTTDDSISDQKSISSLNKKTADSVHQDIAMGK